jgi:hypothetical protein
MKSFFIYGSIAAGIFVGLVIFPSSAFASTNISASASQHWAWNDEIGWIDFSTTGNVTVSPTQLSGYASSSVGSLSLDCGTSPSGNICSSGNGFYKVANDGNGDLSGWAWNDDVGWISFYWGDASSTYPAVGSTTVACASYGPSYCGVRISPSTGIFSGWAWNDTIGWIDFNCANTGICGTSQFDVVTSWLELSESGMLDSQTFDTGVASGAQLNSIIWQGTLPSGTAVGFQIAVSNSSSGPWNFIGPDGTSASTYSTITPGTPIPLLNYASLIGRYFRYRAILTTNFAQTVSPTVNDIVVNWSP